MVPEGRRLFPSLTVEENLLLGALQRSVPVLESQTRLRTVPDARRTCGALPATHLSGGQQQMTTVGRALMSNPRLLLCDELSLGLAPVVIRDIYDCLGTITAEGTTVVIVEQDINRALDASARFYCFLEGRLALDGAEPKASTAPPSPARISACRAMNAMEWLNIVIQGALLGGLYALFAIGLSLSFGIMRLVNIAHGDLIVLSAYVALVVNQGTGTCIRSHAWSSWCR